MQITNISEAKASLSYLIKKVQETDEPIIIGKAGEPVAVRGIADSSRPHIVARASRAPR